MGLWDYIEEKVDESADMLMPGRKGAREEEDKSNSYLLCYALDQFHHPAVLCETTNSNT